MKRLLALLVTIFMLVSVFSTSVIAVGSVKMSKISLTQLKTSARDPSTPPFLVFIGSIKNNTKYAAVIKKLTFKVNLNSKSIGVYKGTIVFDPLNIPYSTEYNSKFPNTIKPGGIIFYNMKNDSAISGLKPNLTAAKADYALTTFKADITYSAKTIKTTKFMKTASATGKLIKTLKEKTSVEVLDLAVKTFIKVKVGTLTGYVPVANIK